MSPRNFLPASASLASRRFPYPHAAPLLNDKHAAHWLQGSPFIVYSQRPALANNAASVLFPTPRGPCRINVVECSARITRVFRALTAASWPRISLQAGTGLGLSSAGMVTYLPAESRRLARGRRRFERNRARHGESASGERALIISTTAAMRPDHDRDRPA